MQLLFKILVHFSLIKLESFFKSYADLKKGDIVILHCTDFVGFDKKEEGYVHFELDKPIEIGNYNCYSYESQTSSAVYFKQPDTNPKQPRFFLIDVEQFHIDETDTMILKREYKSIGNITKNLTVTFKLFIWRPNKWNLFTRLFL